MIARVLIVSIATAVTKINMGVLIGTSTTQVPPATHNRTIAVQMNPQ